jgi:lycopene beta-cyclase
LGIGDYQYPIPNIQYPQKSVFEEILVEHYDFIIAGGGLSGLSLACHLVHSPLRDRSILIVDKDSKKRNDRTWAFWTRQPFLFDEVVYRSWDRLRVVGEDLDKVFALGDYRYKMIRGVDFYRFARRELAGHGNVSFLRRVVHQIQDGAGAARVTVDGRTVSGRWVFDSLFRPSEFKPDLTRYHHLKLHFKGWEIETPGPAFNPQAATLLDLRTPQRGATRFFYVLPFSQRRALVEYTLFSPLVLRRREYEQALRAYLTTVLGIQDYRVLRQEGGCIPITDQPFPRQTGQRIMTIGTPGGRIKPSTGYAFARIQQDSAAIVRSLLHSRHPFDVPANSRRYQLYDALLLDIMCRQGGEIESIFGAMFKHNPIERVFRFLDETASPWENLLAIPTFPPGPFLRALCRLKVWPGPAPDARPVRGHHHLKDALDRL